MKWIKFYGFVLGLILPVSASATYMSNCNALIGKLSSCSESSCNAIDKQITAECKCHVKKGGKWQLVRATINGISADGVCGKRPGPTIKDPSPPHQPRPSGGVIAPNPPRGGMPEKRQ